MAYTICARRGTADAFSVLNRVYEEGELLLEEQVDGSYKLKSGDGSRPYNSLPYVGTSGSAANSFATISVPTQSSVVADSSADTLTLNGLNGIQITTDAANDGITFAPIYGSSGGTVCQGADSRLSDARIPVAHATTHAPGGSDPIDFGSGGLTSFSNVAVSGQSTVVADGPLDTLNLAGNGITVTTNASTDTVTFTPTYGTTAGTVCQGNDARLVSGAAGGVFVEDYGAVGNGSTDDTTAINLAIATGRNVHFRSSVYNVTALSSLASGQYLIGNGSAATKIRSTSTSAKVITINSGVTGAGVIGLTISRTVTPVSGASGIDTAHTAAADVVSLIQILDVALDHHWNGLLLGPTGWGLIRDVFIENCYGDGILMVPTAGTGSVASNPLQWTLDHVLVELCNGHGMLVQGVNQLKGAGTTLSFGEWKNFSTYGNTGGGIAVVGTASCGFCGVRLGSNNFLGEDGNNEVYLDTYGYNHVIQAYVELAGVGTTGVNKGTPSSGIGRGILVTSNNSGVLIHDSVINGCSDEGVYSQANLYGATTAPVTISDCIITNNGAAGVVGAQSGVLLANNSGAGMVISGGFIGQWNTSPGTGPQKYGVSIATDSIAITGCRIRGNATSKTLALAALTSNSYFDGLSDDSVAASGLGGVRNVRYYGAVGDGTADDTAAIQAAALSNSIVYFPPGVYSISPTTFSGLQSCHFVGIGKGYASRLKLRSSGTMLTFSGCANFSVRGLVVSDDSTLSGSRGILITDGSNGQLCHCIFYGFHSNAVKFEGTTPAPLSASVVNDCWFLSNGQDESSAQLYLYECNDFTIVGNQVGSFMPRSAFPGIGVKLEAARAGTFTGNMIWLNGMGCQIISGDYNRITDNRFEESEYTNISIVGSQQSVFCNNWINDASNAATNTYDACQFYNVGSSVISGNVVSSWEYPTATHRTSYSFEAACTGNTVTNNKSLYCGTSHLAVEAGSLGNTFDSDVSFTAQTSVVGGTTVYLGPGGLSASVSIGSILNARCAYCRLLGRVDVAPSSTNTVTFTLMVDGAATGLACTITGSNFTNSSVGYVLASFESVVSVRVVYSASAATSTPRCLLQGMVL